jgi:peptidoglycan/xylan/chitin deacetylase (PgdA/CDA1 family)
MYHRVAEQDPDPWALSVSPQHFAEQMEVLARHRRPIALTGLVSGGRVADVPADAVAVTFDDGYADNLWAAKPILERFGIPATVFVTSVAVDHPREMWWDELERVVVAPSQIPPEFAIKVNGHEIAIVGGQDQPGSLSDRRIAFATKAGHRWRVYETFHRALLRAPYTEKIRALGELASLLGIAAGGSSDRRLMQAQEVQQLGASGLVDIGCHTDTHVFLAGLPDEDQQREISKNKRFLEALLDRPMSSFAYPYGSYDARAMLNVRRAGFSLACHTRPGHVARNANPFELPRVQVEDWDGCEFLKFLSAG